MKKEKQKGHSLRPVEISCHAPDARDVFLAGTFNGWIPARAQCKGPQRECGGQPYNLRRAFTSTNSWWTKWVCKPGKDELDPTLLREEDCVSHVYGTANRRV